MSNVQNYVYAVKNGDISMQLNKETFLSLMEIGPSVVDKVKADRLFMDSNDKHVIQYDPQTGAVIIRSLAIFNGINNIMVDTMNNKLEEKKAIVQALKDLAYAVVHGANNADDAKSIMEEHTAKHLTDLSNVFRDLADKVSGANTAVKGAPKENVKTESKTEVKKASKGEAKPKVEAKTKETAETTETKAVPKEETKGEAKSEVKVETKEAPKTNSNEETKEAPKEEAKVTPKEEVAEEEYEVERAGKGDVHTLAWDKIPDDILKEIGLNSKTRNAIKQAKKKGFIPRLNSKAWELIDKYIKAKYDIIVANDEASVAEDGNESIAHKTVKYDDKKVAEMARQSIDTYDITIALGSLLKDDYKNYSQDEADEYADTLLKGINFFTPSMMTASFEDKVRLINQAIIGNSGLKYPDEFKASIDQAFEKNNVSKDTDLLGYIEGIRAQHDNYIKTRDRL